MYWQSVLLQTLTIRKRIPNFPIECMASVFGKENTEFNSCDFIILSLLFFSFFLSSRRFIRLSIPL